MATIPTPGTPEFDQAASDAFYDAYGVRVAPYELSSQAQSSNGNMSQAAQDWFIEKGQTPFEWGGASTPEGMAFNEYADYAYSHGLAGQDYNTGITKTINDYGYMVPLLAGAAFGGLAAAGAGAAGGAGAGAAAATPEAYMASAGLTPGVFEGAAFTMPSVAGSAGYTGINDYMSQAGLDAGGAYTPTYSGINDYMAQAGLEPGKFEGAAFQMPNSITAKDALSYANRLKSLGSMLSSTSGKGSNPMQLGQLLAGGAPQTNDYLGQIKMNQTPFFGSNQGTLSGEGVYDVSGLVNALRNK